MYPLDSQISKKNIVKSREMETNSDHTLLDILRQKHLKDVESLQQRYQQSCKTFEEQVKLQMRQMELQHYGDMQQMKQSQLELETQVSLVMMNVLSTNLAHDDVENISNRTNINDQRKITQCGSQELQHIVVGSCSKKDDLQKDELPTSKGGLLWDILNDTKSQIYQANQRISSNKDKMVCLDKSTEYNDIEDIISQQRQMAEATEKVVHQALSSIQIYDLKNPSEQ